MENNHQERIAFNLILHSGNARSFYMEAIALAKIYEFTKARAKIKEAEEEITDAHRIQASLIHDEAKGDSIHLSILLIHAQDHLMNALTIKDLACEMIDMYEKFQQIERDL